MDTLATILQQTDMEGILGSFGKRTRKQDPVVHFYETNSALIFDRDRAKGTHLDIPAGTSIRFEPGDEKDINLVPYVGTREIYGFNALVEGKLEN